MSTTPREQIKWSPCTPHLVFERASGVDIGPRDPCNRVPVLISGRTSLHEDGPRQFVRFCHELQEKPGREFEESKNVWKIPYVLEA